MNPPKYYAQTTRFYLLIVLLLGIGMNMHAQETNDRLQQYIDDMLQQPIINTFHSNQQSINQQPRQPSMLQVAKVPEVFCYESMGFFCKIEHKAMQRGNFPLRFRLGEFWNTVEAEYGVSY